MRMKELQDRGYEEDCNNEPTEDEKRRREGKKSPECSRRFFRNCVYPTERFQGEIEKVDDRTERADPPAEEPPENESEDNDSYDRQCDTEVYPK